MFTFAIPPAATPILRLSGARTEPSSRLSLPSIALATDVQYKEFVLKFGGFNVSRNLAALTGAFTGEVINLKGYYRRYGKAPGTETIGIEGQAPSQVVNITRTVNLRMMPAFSESALRHGSRIPFTMQQLTALKVLSGDAGRPKSYTIANAVIGWSCMMNSLCDNTMILDKFYAVQLMCLMN